MDRISGFGPADEGSNPSRPVFGNVFKRYLLFLIMDLKKLRTWFFIIAIISIVLIIYPFVNYFESASLFFKAVSEGGGFWVTLWAFLGFVTHLIPFILLLYAFNLKSKTQVIQKKLYKKFIWVTILSVIIGYVLTIIAFGFGASGAI